MGPQRALLRRPRRAERRRRDFASTVGVGGVVGTQFTLPGNGALARASTSSRRRRSRSFASGSRLQRASCCPGANTWATLYDIGFDRPEAHAIRKDGSIYYAFFARRFRGQVQLRGLAQQMYCVRDYVAGKALASVQGPQADLPVTFMGHLLLEAHRLAIPGWRSARE